MNVIDAGSFYASLALWVAVAIALAVAATYFLRPRVRAHYPGGAKRYLAATIVQASGFMAPIPLVLLFLIGSPVWPGVDVLLAVGAGLVFVIVLRYLPVTGPLLRDLHSARLQAALDNYALSGPKDQSE